MTGGPEAAPGLMHHGGAQGAGDVRRTIGGAVVHDDGPPVLGNAFKDPGQGPGLVEAGQNDIDQEATSAGSPGYIGYVGYVRVGFWGGGHTTHPMNPNRTYRT
ncbi:hypothetical protein GCM10010277_61680 [Streptomyces longisporoflavus]|nr:hypothetical protein GCM10010277_61680 [Streptomyces longisporoflavus]